MARIDCSQYPDGQGPFLNGMHDRIGLVPLRSNLYRSGLRKRWLWTVGWLFQEVTELGVVPKSRV